MEDWKIKVSILWLFRDLAALTILVLWFMQPGALEGIMAGEALGAQITPETMTFLGMQFWAPLAMAFLSLTLKDKPNRLANIIVGTIYTVLSAYGLIGVSVQEVLLRVSATVATALIVWYAWKSRKEGGSL